MFQAESGVLKLCNLTTAVKLDETEICDSEDIEDIMMTLQPNILPPEVSGYISTELKKSPSIKSYSNLNMLEHTVYLLMIACVIL